MSFRESRPRPEPTHHAPVPTTRKHNPVSIPTVELILGAEPGIGSIDLQDAASATIFPLSPYGHPPQLSMTYFNVWSIRTVNPPYFNDAQHWYRCRCQCPRITNEPTAAAVT